MNTPNPEIPEIPEIEQQGVHPQALCPHCSYELDAATNTTDEQSKRPEKDDWSICLYCQNLLRFTDDGSLRKTTPQEFAAEDKDIQQALRKAQEVAKRFMLKYKSQS